MSMQTSFINSIKDGSIVSMRKYGVLASITISQAILESAWGRSKLAYKYKNLFGIKADSSWRGPRINMRTGEYRNGSHVMENWGFRVYSSYAESIEDHARFLVNNSRYGKAGLFSDNNYTGQANALVKAGYATNPDYGKELIILINQYQLYKYDRYFKYDKCNNKYGIVTATVLNVRNGASTNYKVIGQLQKGKRVCIYKEVGDWLEIYFGKNGGYVYKKYIRLL